MLPNEVSILKMIVTEEVWTHCSIGCYEAIYKNKEDTEAVRRSTISRQAGNILCAGLCQKFVSNMECFWEEYQATVILKKSNFSYNRKFTGTPQLAYCPRKQLYPRKILLPLHLLVWRDYIKNHTVCPISESEHRGKSNEKGQTQVYSNSIKAESNNGFNSSRLCLSPQYLLKLVEESKQSTGKQLHNHFFPHIHYFCVFLLFIS